MALSTTKELGGPLLSRTKLLPILVRFYLIRMTRAGKWFFWPCVVIASYSSFSLNYQGYVAFSYCAALWIVAFAGLVLFRPRLKVQVSQPVRVCAGETFDVHFEVTRPRGGLGTDLCLIADRLPEGVDAVEEEGVALPVLARGSTVRSKLRLRAARRGAHQLKGYRVESDYPLGLLNAVQLFREPKPLLVYPAFKPLARINLPMGRRYQPGGVALASVVGESTEFVGDRDYREGDNVRDIDWRATGRHQRLIVREYREEYFFRVAVVLDTHLPKGSPPVRRQDFERAVSLCAAVGDALAREEYIVDIFAAGPTLYHLAAGRSLAYLDQILDILACVEESREEPFWAIEPELSQYLDRMSSAVCVFLDWDDRRREFLEGLRSRGLGVKAIVLRSGPCSSTPDVTGLHVLSPEEVDAGVGVL